MDKSNIEYWFPISWIRLKCEFLSELSSTYYLFTNYASEFYAHLSVRKTIHLFMACKIINIWIIGYQIFILIIKCMGSVEQDFNVTY